MTFLENSKIGFEQKLLEKMSYITILLVEDDPSFALEVEMLIEELGCKLCASVANSRQAVLEAQTKQPDIALVDIRLKGETDGIELAHKLYSMGIPVIFMTAYGDSKIYEKAKSAHPYAFLVKPFDLLTLKSVLQSLKENVKEKNLNSGDEQKGESLTKEHFFIKTNGQLAKVFTSDIKWIHSEGNYCILQTTQRKFVVKMSLTKIKQQLSEEQFIQVHRSYLVQLALITSLNITSNQVFISEDAIPIGRKYKAPLLDRLNLLK